MKKYTPVLQIFKGFFFGTLGFLIESRTNEPDLFIPIGSYVILGFIDNILSEHKFDVSKSWLSIRWSISTVEQLWFNVYLAIGFYFSLIAFRELIPPLEKQFFLYGGPIFIPLTIIFKLWRLKNKHEK